MRRQRINHHPARKRARAAAALGTRQASVREDALALERLDDDGSPIRPAGERVRVAGVTAT